MDTDSHNYEDRLKTLQEENKQLKLKLSHNAFIENSFSGSSIAKVVFDIKGSIIKCSDSFNELFGIGLKSIYAILPPNYSKQLTELIRQNTISNTTNGISVQLIKTDRDVVDATVFITVNEQVCLGEIVLANSFDASTKFNEQLKIATTLQKLSKSASWFMDATGKISWSDEVYRIYEIEDREKYHDFWSTMDFVHEAERNKLIEYLNNEAFSNENAGITYRLIRDDGSTKYLKLKSATGDDDSKFKLVGYVIDITDSYINDSVLMRKEMQYKNLFQRFSDIYMLFELEYDINDNIIDYVFLDVNQSFEKQFEMRKEFIVSEKLSGQLPTVFEQLHSLFKITAIAQQPQQDRLYIAHLDGFFDILIFCPSPNVLATTWRDISLMVKAESSLRESEEKYRQIFSITEEAMFMVDFDSGAILDINRHCVNLLNYNKDELLKLNFEKFSTKQNEFKSKISTKLKLINNEIFAKKDGNLIPVEVSCTFFNWAGRKVYIALVREITERISAQERLIKSEQKFKYLFQLSNNAILLIKKYRIIEFNEKALVSFGLSEMEMLNKTLWNLSPTYQQSGVDSRVASVEHLQNSSMGKPVNVEWTFIKKDGTKFHALLSLSPIAYGNFKVIQVVICDNSKTFVKDLEVRKNEERWKTALEGNMCGVWDWDLVTNEVFYSSVWKSILGYRDDEISNKFDELEKRIHPDDTTMVYNNIDWYLTAKNPLLSIEFRLRCKNGTFKWVLGKGKIAAYSADGNPIRLIATIEDITRHKLKGKQVENEIDELRKATQICQLGNWFLDLRTMIFTGANSAFIIFGIVDTQNISLRLIEKTIHHDDREQFRNQFISNKDFEYKEQSFRVLNGSKVKFVKSYATPIFDDNNVLAGFNGVFQDVTIFKFEANELRTELNSISGICDNLAAALIMIQNDKVIYRNNQFSKLTGYQLKETSNNVFDFGVLLSPDSFGQIVLSQKKIQNDHRLVEYHKLEITTKSKRKKWVELYLGYGTNNNEDAFIYMFNDIAERIKHDQELSTDRTKLKQLVENSTIGIATLNEVGKFTYANNQLLKLLGRLANEVSNLNLDSFTSETNKSDILVALDQISQNQINSFNGVFTLNSTTGISRFVEVNLQKSQDLDKKASVLMYVKDIDKYQKEQNIFRIRTGFYEAIIEGSEEGVGIFIQNKALQFCNEEFRKLLGEISIDNYRTVDLPFYNEFQIRLKKQPLSENGNNIYFKHRFSEKNVCHIQIEKVEFDAIEYLIVRINDVSEHTSNVEQLESKLQIFHGIFENNTLGCALINKSRRIDSVNSKYLEISGYKQEDVLTKKIDEFINTKQLTELVSGYSQLFTGIHGGFSRSLQLMSKSGEAVWMMAHTSAIKNNFGDIISAVTMFEDISIKKKMELQLLNDERIKTINKLAKSTAHEFNNQLMGIYGNAFILKNRLVENDNQDYCQNIIESVNNSKKLTQKLLSFAWTDKKLTLVIDVNKVVNGIVEKVRVNNNQINIVINGELKAHYVIGDPIMLLNAFQNIVDNAIEASKLEATISINISSVYFEDGSDVRGSIKQGKYVRVQVIDEGKGIPDSVQNKIFDVFYTSKVDSLNAGLGLTVAQEIIKLHKGVITFNSKVNIGTTFNIYIPLTDKKIEAAFAPNEVELSGNANIMIVDDEDIVRNITVELLKKLGYNVFSFAEPLSALRFYNENASLIDLVILDLHMPELKGDELFARLKAVNKDIKAILLSGYGFDIDIDSILNEGVLDFIQKPVSIEKLSKVIANVLNKS